MNATTEHPCAAKIRTLLALVASASKVGQHGEAAAAGNAARRMADAAGLSRGYVVKARSCPWSLEHMIDTALLPDWIRATPTDAWRYESDYWLAAFGRAKPPEDDLIIGVITTGAHNARGCVVLLADWSDVHKPMSVHHAPLLPGAPTALPEAA